MDDLPAGEVFTSTFDVDGGVARVQMAGELDLHVVERFTADVRALPLDDLDHVELDTAGISFIDSAGLQAMLTLRDECARRGAGLRLVAVSPTVERVVAIAGVGDILHGDT